MHIAVRSRSKRIMELLLTNPKDGRLLYRPNRAGETPYQLDTVHDKSILTQIHGAREMLRFVQFRILLLNFLFAFFKPILFTCYKVRHVAFLHTCTCTPFQILHVENRNIYLISLLICLSLLCLIRLFYRTDLGLQGIKT